MTGDLVGRVEQQQRLIQVLQVSDHGLELLWVRSMSSDSSARFLDAGVVIAAPPI
jgi:hypothetical protein